MDDLPLQTGWRTFLLIGQKSYSESSDFEVVALGHKETAPLQH